MCEKKTIGILGGMGPLAEERQINMTSLQM